MGEILPSSFKKCCFRYDLVIGCAVYVTVEVYAWAILTLTSIYSEFKMMQNSDVVAFKNFTLQSNYYVTAFGDPADDVSKTLIVIQIVINGLLSVGFLLYSIFAVILLIGISERNLGYFALYLYLDTIALYISLISAALGILMLHSVMLRNSLIFALKFYPSSCIYSLYKKLGGQAVTFNNFLTVKIRYSPDNIPAIHLATSISELEESSRKSSSDCIKPRVSFGNMPEELQVPSMSTPNLSPINVRQQREVSILKPCFRKNLQLPVNNSYP